MRIAASAPILPGSGLFCVSGEMLDGRVDGMSDQEQAGTPETNDQAGAEDAGRDAAANDDAALKGALRQEREARKASERDLRAVRAKLDALEARDKTDVERLTGERDALLKTVEERETRLRHTTARVAVLDAATKTNAVSANAVYALVRDGLEFNEDGEPTNVDEAIASAKKSEPLMFRAAAGAGDGGKREENTGREIRPGLDRLTHAYATESKTANRR